MRCYPSYIDVIKTITGKDYQEGEEQLFCQTRPLVVGRGLSQIQGMCKYTHMYVPVHVCVGWREANRGLLEGDPCLQELPSDAQIDLMRHKDLPHTNTHTHARMHAHTHVHAHTHTLSNRLKTMYFNSNV